MPSVAPYGGWESPIRAAALAAQSIPLTDRPLIVGDDVYWVEGKPSEGGRSVLVRQSATGERTDVTPPGYDVRTRVHEYGGAAYVVHGTFVYFSNFGDQRLYRQELGSEPAAITAITAESGGNVRFADAQVTADGRLVVCVRETHPATGGEPVNDLVVIPADGSAEPRSIASGHDFYAAPRLSPDGRQLAWLTWDHPRMPWDGSELWVGEFAEDGPVPAPRRIAGGPEEAIFQPSWNAAGQLHFCSDRTGWWNLYRHSDDGDVALAPDAAEFGVPHWQFGSSTYAFLDDGRIAAIVSSEGIDRLAFVSEGVVTSAELPYTAYAPTLSAYGDVLVFVAGTPSEPAAVIRFDTSVGEPTVLRRSSSAELPEAYIARPQSISFPTDDGGQAYAIYYPPTNPEFVAPEGTLPPLLVMSHGGPTGMARAQFSSSTQYWTTRGFAVVDVNYGGSSGFGRTYRNRLQGNWGVVDTADCIDAARFLADQGLADPGKLVIRGGSAGGYTTLCALVFHDVFAAGASYYGVADCETLATDTHKFESRYLDGLIGPYPQSKELYRQRSPVHYADRISCPVILFQGLEDLVVPPNQAETFVAALRAKRLPFAYLEFEGEQHGFRKAETITRTTEAELYFYAKVLSFPLAEAIDPVDIEFL